MTQLPSSVPLLPTMTVAGIATVTSGNVQFSNFKAEGIDFSSLVTINDNLTFTNLELSSLPDLRYLQYVGSLYFTNVDLLEPAPFKGLPLISAEKLNFTDTAVTGIGPFSSSFGTQMGTQIASVFASGNKGMTSIELSYPSSGTTAYLEIHDNADTLNILLNNTHTVGLSLSDITSFQANDLRTIVQQVDGGYSYISGSNLSTLSLPALSDIEKLQITDNPDLVNLSLPALASVGMLKVTDNSELTNVNFLKLTSISDELQIEGDINKYVLCACKPLNAVLTDTASRYLSWAASPASLTSQHLARSRALTSLSPLALHPNSTAANSNQHRSPLVQVGVHQVQIPLVLTRTRAIYMAMVDSPPPKKSASASALESASPSSSPSPSSSSSAPAGAAETSPALAAALSSPTKPPTTVRARARPSATPRSPTRSTSGRTPTAGP